MKQKVIESAQSLVQIIKESRKAQVLGLGLVGIVAWYALSSESASSTTYNLQRVTKDSITSYISLTGQIEVEKQVDIHPSTNSKLLSVAVIPGDTVKKGQILARTDSRQALISLSSARISLENAKKKYKTASGILGEEDAYTYATSVDSAKNSLSYSRKSATTKLDDAYTEYVSVLQNKTYSFFQNPNTLTPTLYIQNIPLNNQELQTKIEYERSKLVSAQQEFKNVISRTDQMSSTSIYSSINDATIRLQSTLLYLDDLSTILNSSISSSSSADSTLSSYRTTVSSARSSISNQITALTQAKQSLEQSELTLEKAESDLKFKTTITDSSDISIAKAELSSAEANYSLMLENYNNTTVRAPFDGTVGSVLFESGDEVSPSDTIMTVITNRLVATLSVNEVDAAKVRVGQKATLIFDALEDVTFTGTVQSVSPVGTVSQGVVTYAVKVSMDTVDERVMGGMSVTANIITETKHDVLVLDNSAIKKQSGNSYVETVSAVDTLTITDSSTTVTPTETTKKINIVVGLQGEDVSEIVSGLEEGQVVLGKKTQTAGATTTQQSGIPFLGGGMRR